MKKCPSCGRTYTDPALNFCLQDGAVLEQGTVSTFGNEETVVIGQTPSTNPGNPGGSPYGRTSGGSSAGGNLPPNAQPNTWQNAQYTAQPRKKKSKAWIVILLALFGFAVIGVVGVVGFLIYLGSKIQQEEAANKAKSNSNSSTNSRTWKSPSPGSSPTSSGGVTKADFSVFETGELSYGKVEFKDGKLTVATKLNNYYCGIPANGLLSNDVTSRVTVKNTNKGATDLGFGLIVNSSPLKALLRDYAFLIRTDGTPAYRIVSHSATIEKDLVKWTSSSAIKKGDEENTLEVRDEGKKLSFYINGQFMKSVDDDYGDTNTVAGIYAGDAIPITFSNLEVEAKD